MESLHSPKQVNIESEKDSLTHQKKKKKKEQEDFPDDPVAKILYFHCKG